MEYHTGIASDQESPTETVIAAVTWHRKIPPNFPTRHIPLLYARSNLCACVVVYGTDLVQTIDAACHRTAEQLCIRTKFNTRTPPDIGLIVPPALARHTYILPHVKMRNHWLLSAAESTLLDWLRGVR